LCDKSGSDDLDEEDFSHRYLWGPVVDQLFADEQIVEDTDGEILWALADNLGSVRDVVDYSGELRIHRRYDGFGNVVDETHYNTSGVEVNALQAGYVDEAFGYTGRYFDSDTGLQNNLNRWYDASVGRWISEDPIGFAAGDANLYRYVGNSSTGFTDPSGLEKCGPRVWLYTGSWCVPDNVWNAAIDASGEVVTCWWECEKRIHSSVAAPIADTAGAAGMIGFTHMPIPKPPSLFLPGMNPNTTAQSLSSLGAKVCRIPAYGDLARAGAREAKYFPIRSGIKSGAAGVAIIEAGISIHCGWKCSK